MYFYVDLLANKFELRAGKLVQPGKVPSTKREAPSSIPWTHTVRREPNRLTTCPQTSILTLSPQNKCKWDKIVEIELM